MPKNVSKYTISVQTGAPPERIYEIITNLEKIKIWEPSHSLPFVSHEWIPSSGMLKVGNILKVKSKIWTFIAKCVALKNGQVKWEFTGGPLKGTESWMLEAIRNGCIISKIMEYEVLGFINRLLWRILGKRIHYWASSKQLRSIKRLAES